MTATPPTHAAQETSVSDTKLQAGDKPETNQPEYFVRVVGLVQYRDGDGPLMDLPHVRAGVNEALASVVLGWMDEGEPKTVTLAKPEYELYLQRGAIVRA